MYAPFEILPYSIEALAILIQRVTTTPYHSVCRKKQVVYLDHYLKHLCKDNSIQMVVENHYIDQHYMDDFSQYYVRCFQQYPRECTRVHFLLSKNDDEFLNEFYFHEVLSGNKTIEAERYLGFIIFRPIPHTFLARVCLRVYPHIFETKDKYRILTKPIKSSLFGLPFEIDTVPFQEQDRVLSACATSALWSFYYAHRCVSLHSIPSSISITKSAYPNNSGMNPMFPNSGLSPEMMCRSIRTQGLEPFVIDVKKNNLLVEHIYAYSTSEVHSKSGWPTLLGLKVFDNNNKYKGLHAVTVLGHKLEDESNFPQQAEQIRLRAHRIKILYIHDDRIGPFASLEKSVNNSWRMEVYQDTSSKPSSNENEIYRPIIAILGVYHKLRIQYSRIKSTCQDLNTHLKKCCNVANKISYENKELLVRMINAFEWDIRVEEARQVKERLIAKSSIYERSCREDFLVMSLPRFIWVVRIRIGIDDFAEFFLDATDIPQGRAFLSFIFYDSKSDNLFNKHFRTYCNEYYTDFVTPEHHTSFIWGVFDFFKRKKLFMDTMDGMFGKLKTPQYIKPNEHTLGGSIQYQNPFILHSPNDSISLSQDVPYIWVINQDGTLVIGDENNLQEKSHGGHVTLLSGDPGRIAGELCFCKNKCYWLINDKSGRYSYCYSREKSKEYLENALKNRFRPFLSQYNFQILDENLSETCNCPCKYNKQSICNFGKKFIK